MEKTYEKCTPTAYLRNSKKPNKSEPKCSNENIERVKRSTEENPKTSFRCGAAQLNITHTTLCCIIDDDLGMYPYGILPR